jgi:hypothetical protein
MGAVVALRPTVGVRENVGRRRGAVMWIARAGPQLRFNKQALERRGAAITAALDQRC